MTEQDLPAFTGMLDAVCSMLSRGAYMPNDMSTGMFFRALLRYSLADVRSALDAHVSDPLRGRFVPVPADLIAQLEQRAGDDGRLGPEEAFALALAARDEWASVVWTQEVAEAWGVARHVLPDEVGARMAFKEAYTRIVAAARASRQPHAWVLCQGFDMAGRTLALTMAAEKGRHVDGVSGLLALPLPSGEVLALTGPDSGTTPPGLSAVARASIARIRAAMASGHRHRASPGIEDRDRTNELRAEAVAKVATYAAAHGIPITTNRQQGGQQHEGEQT